MSGHHDLGNKDLFSHRELVRDLLVGFTDLPCLRELELTALERVNASYVSEHFAERHGDMVWKLRIGSQCVFVYLLLEFQSRSERWMALRIQVYIGLLYQDLVKRSELVEGDRLPPVLPVVLYNGRTPWNASNDLRTLVAPGPAELTDFQASQRYLLIDQRRIAETSLLSARNLVALLFQIELMGLLDVQIDNEEAAALLAWLGGEERSFLRRSIDAWIQQLQLRETGKVSVECLAQLLEEKAMGERFEHASWAEYEQHKGFERGKAQTLRYVLIRQLQIRFGGVPVPLSAVIENAPVDRLELWIDRVLDAPVVEAVFSD